LEPVELTTAFCFVTAVGTVAGKLVLGGAPAAASHIWPGCPCGGLITPAGFAVILFAETAGVLSVVICCGFAVIAWPAVWGKTAFTLLSGEVVNAAVAVSAALLFTGITEISLSGWSFLQDIILSNTKAGNIIFFMDKF
jgi:hypothetical protein